MDPKNLVNAAKRKGMDGIAVTDHDTMENVETIREYADKLEIIPGVELTTTEGHILAWFVNEVPESKDPLEVIEDVHNQGGYTCLAHPMDFLRQTFRTEEVYNKTDFIEAINSRVLPFWLNSKAQNKANKSNLPITGGSDAHFRFEIGRAFTSTEIKIEEALKTKKTRAEGRGGYLSGHIATKITQFTNLSF
jgi:predicted metal-dependent phosphoesterase TrpH